MGDPETTDSPPDPDDLDPVPVEDSDLPAEDIEIPAEDIEIDSGWEEKGLGNGTAVEDTAEPNDWLEEGDVVTY